MRWMTPHLNKHGGQEGLQTDGRAADRKSRSDRQVDVFDQTRQLSHHSQVAQEVLVIVHHTQLRKNVLPAIEHYSTVVPLRMLSRLPTNKFPNVAFGSK